MKDQLQCVPTPFMWLSRGQGRRGERIGARLGDYIATGHDATFIDRWGQSERIGARSSSVIVEVTYGPFREITYTLRPFAIPTFGNGEVGAVPQSGSEILGAKSSSAPSFNWAFTTLWRTADAERIGALPGDVSAGTVFSWAGIVSSPALTETLTSPQAGGITFSNGPLVARDDAESHTDGATLNGLTLAGGSYTDRTVGEFYLNATEDMESYTDGAALNGLAGGNYSDRDTNLILASDDMESYTDGAALNGLAGGNYVDR